MVESSLPQRFPQPNIEGNASVESIRAAREHIPELTSKIRDLIGVPEYPFEGRRWSNVPVEPEDAPSRIIDDPEFTQEFVDELAKSLDRARAPYIVDFEIPADGEPTRVRLLYVKNAGDGMVPSFYEINRLSNNYRLVIECGDNSQAGVGSFPWSRSMQMEDYEAFSLLLDECERPEAVRTVRSFPR